jgi:hypothetical protein
MYVRRLLNYTFKNTLFYHRLLLLMVLMVFSTTSLYAQNSYTDAGLSLPTVTSDKDDYAPGEVATITGTGWTLDQYVDIHLEEEPSHDHHHSYHDTKVNADGTWEIKYQIEERHLGVKFTVVVDGKQTGYQGLAYFTDANVTFAAIGLPAGTPLKVSYRINSTSGTPLLTESFIPPSTPAAVVVAKDNYINYTFPDVTVAGVLYSSSTITAGSNSQTGPTNSYTLPNNGANTITGIYVASCTAPSITTQPLGSAITYGDANPVFLIATSGEVSSLQWQVSSDNGGTWSNITNATNANYTVSNPSVVMSGYKYRVVVAGCNTTFTSNAAELTVNPKPLAITVNPKTKVYGNVNPLLDGTVNGIVAGDNISVNYSTTATATSDVGTYPITATISDPNNKLANYTVTNTTSSLTITPASASLSLSNLSYTYNGSPQEATVSSSPANLTGVSITYNGSATPPTAAGSYAINATLSNPNYQADAINGTMVISKATATVTLSDLEHIYNGSDKTAATSTSATGTSSFIVTYDGSSDLPVNHKDGGYTVIATLVNDNYAGSATGTLLINKAEQVITWNTPSSITYGTALSSAQLNATALGGAALTYLPADGSVLNAGTQTLKVIAAESNNYKADSKEVSLTVNKAPVILTLGNLSHTYDGTLKLATATTTPAIAGVTVTGSGTNAGDYVATASLSNPNYEAEPVSGTLTIAKAMATIVVSGYTGTYNGLSHGATGTAKGVNNETLEGLNLGASFTNVPGGTANWSFSNANYSNQSGSVEISISKANATLALGSLAHTYNGEPKMATASTVPADLSGVSISNNGHTNAGTYPIVASLDNPNYEAVSANGNLVINKATATLTFQNLTGHTYDGETKNATVVTSPQGLNGVTITNNGQVNAGSYLLNATLDHQNYEAEARTGTLVISKAALAIKADNATKVYGEVNPAFSGAVVSGAVQGETFNVTASSAATASSSIGDYDIIPSVTGTTLDNYEVTATKGKLTISPKAITVTPAAGQGKVYGTADPALTYSSTALVGTDTFMGALAREAGSNVGAYTINQGSLALNSNYTLNVEEGVKFNITPKSVTASIVAENKVYDGNTTALATGSVPANDIVGNDALTVLVSDAVFANKNVGSWNVTAGVALGGAAAGNYSLSNSTASAAAAITAKDITGSFVAASKVYDGTAFASITSSDLTGVVANDVVSLAGGAASFADKNAGTGKTVTLSGAVLAGSDKDNYRLISVNTAIADIYKKSASVTPAANSKTYGAPDPALTGSTSDFLIADNISPSYSRVAGETVVGGPYTISAALSPEAALSNYNITYNTASFTINKASLTATAEDKSRKYGAENPQLTVSYSGFVNGEGINVLTEAPVPSTSATQSSGVGNYPISVTGGVAANYSLTYVAGTLTINKADIAVVADNKNKIYGDANPAFTGAVTGIMNNDVITAAYSTAATTASPVGDYDIVPSLSGTALVNYNLPDITKGKLTIDKAALTVRANNASKVYGNANPVFSGELSGVKNGDAVTGSYTTTANNLSGVGAYVITAGVNATQTILDNYNLTATNGELVITARPVTVAAVAKEKYCGQTDPTLTYTLTGSLVGQDTFSGALSRLSGENVGTYTIQQGTLALSNNYILSYTPASVTIKGVTLDASSASTPKSYTSNVTITVTVKDGAINLSDVPVSLLIDNMTYGPVNSVNGVATFNLNTFAVNVYQVKAIGGTGCSESAEVYMPIYDPEGGFVTGGGWIMSPEGAYVSKPTAAGKANFGFVAKYKKGSTTVDGNTEFQFTAGDLNFKSSSHQAMSLVVAGAKAIYKGEGSINGKVGYGFMVSAIDGNLKGKDVLDKFRIKIWELATGATVYDNQMNAAENADATTDIGGGSIVIHEVKSSSKSSSLTTSTAIPTPETGQFYNYPNTFTDRTTIVFSLEKSESYLLEVYDMRGVLIKKVDMGVAESGKLYELEFDGRALSKGMYIARLLTPSGAKSIKMLLNK